MDKRALRRHHRERLKKNRKAYWGHETFDEYGRGHMDARCAGMVINTPKLCHCWMCINPRKREGLTIQEKKHKVPSESFSDLVGIGWVSLE